MNIVVGAILYGCPESLLLYNFRYADHFFGRTDIKKEYNELKNTQRIFLSQEHAIRCDIFNSLYSILG